MARPRRSFRSGARIEHPTWRAEVTVREYTPVDIYLLEPETASLDVAQRVTVRDNDGTIRFETDAHRWSDLAPRRHFTESRLEDRQVRQIPAKGTSTGSWNHFWIRKGDRLTIEIEQHGRHADMTPSGLILYKVATK